MTTAPDPGLVTLTLQHRGDLPPGFFVDLDTVTSDLAVARRSAVIQERGEMGSGPSRWGTPLRESILREIYRLVCTEAPEYNDIRTTGHKLAKPGASAIAHKVSKFYDDAPMPMIIGAVAFFMLAIAKIGAHSLCRAYADDPEFERQRVTKPEAASPGGSTIGHDEGKTATPADDLHSTDPPRLPPVTPMHPDTTDQTAPAVSAESVQGTAPPGPVAVSGPEQELRIAIGGRQAFFLVGAGVSIGATRGEPYIQVDGKKWPVAGWVGLLHHGVDFCQNWMGMGADWTELLRREIARHDIESLLSVATKLENRLTEPGTGLFQKWLRESVGALPLKHRVLLDALAALKVPIATTNYDGLLEKVIDAHAFTWRQANQFQRVLDGDERGVIHLHGYWEDPGSIVLGNRSYEAIIRHPSAQLLLRSLMATRTVVLVGYGGGLDDPNFGPLMAEIRKALRDSEKPRFRLKLKDEPGDVRAEYPIVPVSYGRTHDELAPFLRRLSPDILPGLG